VRKLSGTNVSDVTSGFRAYSRDAALRLTVLSGFTYTHETLIQAGRSNMQVAEVPIDVNPKKRPSRLFRSIPQYIAKSLNTITRIYAVYEPFRFFGWIAALFILTGLVLSGRYLYFMAIGEGRGHVQSVVLAGVLLMVGFQVGVLGILADLIAANRKLLQDVLFRLRKEESARTKLDEEVVREREHVQS